MIPLRTGVLAVLALGTLVYAATRSDKKRGKAKPRGKFVGDPGYVWPMIDQFPNEGSFGSALEQLEYEIPGDWLHPQWSVLLPDVMEVIVAFQSDYNLVDARFGEMRGQIPITGHLDPLTIAAVIKAFEYEDAMGFEWPMVVTSASQQPQA